MKTLISILTFCLLTGLSAITYGAEPEHHGAPTEAASAPVAASAAQGSNGYWLEAHTTVKVEDKYQWVIAVIMCFVVLFMLEESEEHHKKKKHRR
jgi:hypothetical protein